MPDSGNGAPNAPLDTQTAEQKMRRALGLHSSNKGQSPSNAPRTPQQRPDQARQRHRFVQDGGVPVTVVNHRTDESGALKERIGDLERMLETERTQHAAARRALTEAQAAVQAIETRLVHAELAHQEALNQERRALDGARLALAEAQAQLHQAPALRRRSLAEPSRVTPEPVVEEMAAAPLATKAAATVEPKKRGRPRTRPLPEPKPVRWWTPSFRSKGKA